MKLTNNNPTHNINLIPTAQHHNHCTWVEINASAFEHNLVSYKNIIGNTLLAPVIKSNAYGHSIEHIAKLCDQHIAVDMICVVNITEALFLRSIGIKKPILVLSIVHGNFEQAITNNIDLAVHDLEAAQRLSNFGVQTKQPVNVHIKIDTGLSRLGIPLADAINTIINIHALPYINIRGIFTHFSESENTDQTFTNLQIARFNAIIEKLEQQNIHIPLRHTSCSAAITANKNCHFTMARAGIGMYGLWPSTDNKQICTQEHPQFFLKPVLTWKTVIIQIKEIPAQSFIGYNRTRQVEEATRLAILPIGYWDGYDRRLSNKGNVMINGHLAPVVGRIAMNLTTINVTNLQAKLGDEVTLLGNHPGITAEDLAQHCGTINYEIVTRINPLLPRVLK